MPVNYHVYFPFGAGDPGDPRTMKSEIVCYTVSLNISVISGYVMENHIYVSYMSNYIYAHSHIKLKCVF